MDIDNFLFNLAMIFIPGIMWALADRRLGYEQNPPIFVLILKIFLFGSLTYVPLIILEYFGWLPDISEFVKESVHIFTGGSEEVPKKYELLVFSIPTSAVLTVIWLFLGKINAFTRFLINIGAIKSARQVSLISAALECPSDSTLIVRIWDFENDRSLKGELDGFDEFQDVISLILKKVEICDIDGNVLNKVNHYIFSRPIKNFEFEIITTKEKTCNK